MSRRKVIHKVFFVWDWEAEEIWLNRMARKGWHLVKAGFFRYEFEQGEPGAWQYRLQALNSHASTEESQTYLAFVESTGAEVVDTFLYWAYFRQRTELGHFEIFSDADSKIKHLKRIMAVIYAVLPIMLLNIVNLTRLLMMYDHSSSFMFVMCICFVMLMSVFSGAAIYGLVRMHRKIKKLQSDSHLME